MLIFEEEKRAPLHASDYHVVGSYTIANDKKEYKTFLLLLHQKLEHRVQIPWSFKSVKTQHRGLPSPY